MSYCNHPSNRVTHDITEGDWPYHSVQWCQICGAFRVSVHIGEASVTPTKYVSPWTVAMKKQYFTITVTRKEFLTLPMAIRRKALRAQAAKFTVTQHSPLARALAGTYEARKPKHGGAK